MNDKLGYNAQLQQKSDEKYLIEEIHHLREENKTKKCKIQTLMENQNNLLNRIKSIDRNHPEMFSTQHAQSSNFITPRSYSKNCDARKSFTIETRNQLQPLENVIEEQLNRNELNMAHETTNNPRNKPTLSTKKSVKKLPSSTNPADNNFVSSDIDNCINNTRRSEKKNDKKISSQQSEQITKRLLILGDSIVKNIEPYKMKNSTKYITTVNSIPEAITEVMSHHVKGFMVYFAPDIVLLHCDANNLKKRSYSSENRTEYIEVGREDRGKRDVLFSGIINRSNDYHAKLQKVNEFLSEIKTRKNVKYIDNGNIGLDMLNRSKLYLNRFGLIQLAKSYREILKP